MAARRESTPAMISAGAGLGKRVQESSMTMAASFACGNQKRFLARFVKRERATTANDPFVIELHHFGDCTKVAMVLWRYLTSLEPTAAESRIYHLHKKAANT
jgi:hypothetical protein